MEDQVRPLAFHFARAGIAQHGGHAAAVDGRGQRGRVTGEFGHGGKEIEAGDGHLAHAAGLHAGPDHDEGHADAAFIQV